MANIRRRARLHFSVNCFKKIKLLVGWNGKFKKLLDKNLPLDLLRYTAVQSDEARPFEHSRTSQKYFEESALSTSKLNFVLISRKVQ